MSTPATENLNTFFKSLIQTSQWIAGWWKETLWARLMVGALFLALASWWSWNEFRSISWHTVHLTMHEADSVWIIAAIISTLMVSTSMGFYAAYAFPEGSKKLSFILRGWIGFIIAGIANVFALGGIGSTSIRFFIYTRKGLNAREVATGVARLGTASVSALIGWIVAFAVPISSISVTGNLARITIILTVSFAFHHFASRRVEQTLRSLHDSPLPKPPAIPLLGGAIVEWGASAFTLFALIRSVGIEIALQDCFRTYFVGIITGLLSMLPGGAGSADTVWLTLLQHYGASPDNAAAATLLLRVIAYLGPLMISLIASVFLFNKLSIDRLQWQRRLLALSTALGAILFLISTATPSMPSRLEWMEHFTPIGVVELSHVAAVLSGTMLLLLTRGIWRGYRSAFVVVGALLATSIIAHFFKGADWEEASFSLILLLLLLSASPAFTRKGGLDLSAELTLAIGMAAIFFYLFTGFTSFARFPHFSDLWSRFALHAETTRFFRTGIVLLLFIGIMVIRRATLPLSRRILASADEINQAEQLVKQWGDTAEGLLIGGGDKAVWFWQDKGLILYQIEGNKVICLKDPVIAPSANRHEMLRAFIEETRRQDREIVFSMISGSWWETLHDFGFRMLKLTEEALIDLPEFTMDGADRKGLRRTLREVEKLGVTAKVLLPPHAPLVVEGCRLASDAWLAAKGGHELQFSACYFSETYLQRHPIVAAVSDTGEIIAFVNVLLTRPGGPSTLDFMRYHHDRVENVMDYVIAHAIFFAKEQGATTFSIGGAAMRAVGQERTANHVERLLYSISRKAERIYNYSGLERYKAKFHPRWEPRYLAYQNPMDWASPLIANARLVQARRKEDRIRIANARMAPVKTGAGTSALKKNNRS